MTQKWYKKAEVQVAIVAAILLPVVVSLVARLDNPASTQPQIMRDPAPRKEMRPEFGAGLASDPMLAAIHLTIWNNTDALITVENLVLNWEFRTCERVVANEGPRTQFWSPASQRKLVFEYTAKVVLPSSNGAAHLTFTDASDTVSRGVFKYAKGDVDSFWIAIKTPKVSDPMEGQSYDLWATFNYRHASESQGTQFMTDRITRGTCTRVVAK
jgi:hypothetical protein